ncbi:LOW QUALITY PROTEIN: Protein kinase-like domain containing protein [Parasponia andersonii]|uniref:non-specific serine/threonine protein kinase n=1 Tax=Parasponia andersonii TaxID=3476 RepID=A0A2P5B285_PARAD|nr:LOW QUALITY PROTEIN: Protein kinase-like domain containing protein [Parasponia andersonii]
MNPQVRNGKKKKKKGNSSVPCNIIEGIARGVLYLYEDSRLKVIHCYQKASNVLLDNMNPNVSDLEWQRCLE